MEFIAAQKILRIRSNPTPPPERLMNSQRFVAFLFLFDCLFSPAGISAAQSDDRMSRPILVLMEENPSEQTVSATRVPLGIPNDYKPFLARLKSRDLLVAAFCFGEIPGIDGCVERAIFWRSKDGGKTLGPREERLDIQGRVFGLTTLHDGTLHDDMLLAGPGPLQNTLTEKSFVRRTRTNRGQRFASTSTGFRTKQRPWPTGWL